MAEIDERLILRLREGSYEAFEAVYNRYKLTLAAAMLRQVKDPELVSDLLQELFVRLWERRRSIDPAQSVQAYLYRIAENLIYDTFRNAARQTRLQEKIRNVAVTTHPDPEQQLSVGENRNLIRKAIDLLPPRRRQIYILCKLESRSYEEVSKLLNISVSTINDHVYKANLFLKKYLSNEIHPVWGLILIFLSL